MPTALTSPKSDFGQKSERGGTPMSLEIKRLHLAKLNGGERGQWPVHGFVITHPGGAVLVDTPVWETSIGRVRSMTPFRVHFCHHTDIVHD
jgi:hypothetical protein